MDTSDFDVLAGKTSIVKPGASVQYMLFSKSGFSKRMTARAESDKRITLVTLSDLIE